MGSRSADRGRGRLWAGTVLIVAGVGFALGFAFVPPQVLIPELIRDPSVRLPEGLVGLWLAGIGVVLLISARRHAHARRRAGNARRR